MRELGRRFGGGGRVGRGGDGDGEYRLETRAWMRSTFDSFWIDGARRSRSA